MTAARHFEVGQKVEYRSRSSGLWIPTEIVRVSATDGSVEVLCKHGTTLPCDSEQPLAKSRVAEAAGVGARTVGARGWDGW